MSDLRLDALASHSRRLIHGSISTYVFHHASVPVLVVHGAASDLQPKESKAAV